MEEFDAGEIPHPLRSVLIPIAEIVEEIPLRVVVDQVKFVVAVVAGWPLHTPVMATVLPERTPLPAVDTPLVFVSVAAESPCLLAAFTR